MIKRLYFAACVLAVSNHAAAVDLLRGVADIAAGTGHTCAALDDGTVACWGDNSSGQLGDGTKTPSLVPSPVVTSASSRHRLDAVVSVASGELGSCALRANGDVYCWGAASLLGTNAIAPSTTAVRVPITGAVAVTVGDGHACALLGNASHSVTCWGDNSHGQLGDGSFSPRGAPVNVSGSEAVDVIQLTAGGLHTCATRADSKIACWGANGRGQLGNGSTTDSASPTVVAITYPDHSQTQLSGIVQTAAGRYHTCARFTNNTAACWGDNAYGELGDPSAPSIQPSPVGVAGPLLFYALTSADDYTCSSIANGHMACWGRNDEGQFGTGDSREYATPAFASNAIVATRISAGRTHTCFLATDRTARCLGGNSNGQLGGGFAGTPQFSPIPVVVGRVGDDIFADGLQID